MKRTTKYGTLIFGNYHVVQEDLSRGSANPTIEAPCATRPLTSQTGLPAV